MSINAAGVVEMIDTFDRPGGASAQRVFAGTGKYAEAFKDEPGKRIPKAGVYAEAGVGRANAQWSVFDAEAKGPNACAKAEASLASLGASAFAKAEVASASASAGPLKATVGLSADTGVGISATGAEVKVLGTGFSFGRKMGVSLFGTGFEFNLW